MLLKRLSKKWYGLIIGSIIIILISSYFLYQYKFVNLNPNSKETYYKIFNKDEILKGDENNATIVDQKLDKRLAHYHQAFEKMAGTTDEKKLRALFYMNFVHMYGYYGERTLNKKTFNELLWDSEYFHCLTNTIFLQMLLERAGGYEIRAVGINGRGDHSYLEIKFDNQWQILDPTLNLWIDKSTEELMNGVARNNKNFFLKAEDHFSEKAHHNVYNILIVEDMMTKIGKSYKVKLSEYNCCFNLSEYQY